MQKIPLTNPTKTIDLDFGHYLQLRSSDLSAHLIGGIPDYAFSLDQKLGQQLAALKPVRAIAQILSSSAAPFKQYQLMYSVAVSPQQYPEIYALGEDCAKRLGIGIPQIFISNNNNESNAYTIATENVAPMIVLSSSLVNELEEQELKFVIGHECGHIQNLHGVYNTVVELLTNDVLKNELTKGILSQIPGWDLLETVIQETLKLLFLSWSRCAEISCDRAGLVCCGDATAAKMALVKLAIGGGNRLQQINLEEFLKQLEKVQATPVRFLELFDTHPLILKRIEAIRLFAECEVFYSWHPEMRSTNTAMRSKAEIDDLCEKSIAILG